MECRALLHVAYNGANFYVRSHHHGQPATINDAFAFMQGFVRQGAGFSTVEEELQTALFKAGGISDPNKMAADVSAPCGCTYVRIQR